MTLRKEALLFEKGRPVSGTPDAVGVVFQEPRLLSWLDVSGNVAFGIAALPAAERRRRVEEAVGRVGLAGQARLWPKELSGGMAHRVALARALVTRPRILLIDEPVGLEDKAMGRCPLDPYQSRALETFTHSGPHRLGNEVLSARCIGSPSGRAMANAPVRGRNFGLRPMAHHDQHTADNAWLSALLF